MHWWKCVKILKENTVYIQKILRWNIGIFDVFPILSCITMSLFIAFEENTMHINAEGFSWNNYSPEIGVWNNPTTTLSSVYCSLPNNYLVTFHLYIKHKFCIRANVNSCIISTASNVHCSKYSMTLQKTQKLGNVGFAFYYEI